MARWQNYLRGLPSVGAVKAVGMTWTQQLPIRVLGGSCIAHSMPIGEVEIRISPCSP